jgi:transglutaminase-like putative cysteine protease
MKYRICHTTTYAYSEPVSLCHNLVHVTPRPTARQHCLRDEVLVQPEPDVLQRQIDYFGNITHFFTIQEPHKQLTIISQNLTEVFPAPALMLEGTPAWESAVQALRPDGESRSAEVLDACQFSFDSTYIKRQAIWRDFAVGSFLPGRPLLSAVMDLTTRIHGEFQYDPRSTTVATPLHEMFERRRGVCQDFAHLQIACLRSLGLAARYVSGYLRTTAAPGQEHLIGADASHAWIQVFCPGLGWVDFDPTNNVLPSDQHILVAWGRDYDDVSPIKGIILGGEQHTLGVTVDVSPLEDSPAPPVDVG